MQRKSREETWPTLGGIGDPNPWLLGANLGIPRSYEREDWFDCENELSWNSFTIQLNEGGRSAPVPVDLWEVLDEIDPEEGVTCTRFSFKGICKLDSHRL